MDQVFLTSVVYPVLVAVGAAGGVALVNVLVKRIGKKDQLPAKVAANTKEIQEMKSEDRDFKRTVLVVLDHHTSIMGALVAANTVSLNGSHEATAKHLNDAEQVTKDYLLDTKVPEAVR